MVSSLKVEKKYIHVYWFIAFVGSTSRAGVCVACMKLTTLGGRIVNRPYLLIQKSRATNIARNHFQLIMEVVFIPVSTQHKVAEICWSHDKN